MTAIQRVRDARKMLGAGAAVSAVAWGAAVALGMLAVVSFVGLAIPTLNDEPARQLAIAVMAVAVLAGAITAGARLWRSRHIVSLERVALWIEEIIPGLQYSLMTAIEPEHSDFALTIEHSIELEDIKRATARALRRRMTMAVGAASVAAALLYVSPSAAFGGGGLLAGLRGAGAGSGADTLPGSRLGDLRALVVPPAYTGLRSTSLDDPTSIPALAGSRVTLTGPGQANSVSAVLGGLPMRVSAAGQRWSATVVMPQKPAALTLGDRGFERIIVLEPRADNPPRISLLSPARDTTLRVARLMIDLDARASDDIGLTAGYFEYLVTTGSGEVFSARTITTPPVPFGGARTGSLRATLDLASLKLGQGDVVSIRAIAQDANTLSGPGIATSDTRTFRVARADEYDSVAVDAAAPSPVDSSAMSQRMLIMMTEELVKQEKNITRSELVKRATGIGDLEDRIRKRVYEILYETEPEDEGGEAGGGGGGGGVATEAHSEDTKAVDNPDLMEAYNALWQAVRSLQIAEPSPALPPMRVALKALDRARLANRLYLRGQPPRVIVDLARVRMTGKDKGSGSVRTPLTLADTARALIERRFGDALEMLERSPQSTVRAFTLLRVDALTAEPAFAGALGEAIEAFRSGRDATLPLLRARRALMGTPTGTAGLPAWSGAR